MAIIQNQCYAGGCIGTAEELAPDVGTGHCWGRRALKQTSICDQAQNFVFTFSPVVLQPQKQPFLLLELLLCMNSIRMCGLGL